LIIFPSYISFFILIIYNFLIIDKSFPYAEIEKIPYKPFEKIEFLNPYILIFIVLFYFHLFKYHKS